jgi:crotonobetainyl-CoA:carnitine CoA-transferase CaiB-like acyl-CoA transferase
VTTKLPALPIEMDGRRSDIRADPPALGADTANVLAELGMPEAELAELAARSIIAIAQDKD